MQEQIAAARAVLIRLLQDKALAESPLGGRRRSDGKRGAILK